MLLKVLSLSHLTLFNAMVEKQSDKGHLARDLNYDVHRLLFVESIVINSLQIICGCAA